MGQEQSKQAPQPDLSTALFSLKMAGKRFQRESTKAEKEKEKNLKKVEACLKKGDEESARMYAVSAQNNINEAKKYLRMSCRLEAIAGQMKSNNSMNDVMKQVTQNVNPILMKEADSMDIKTMVQNFEVFQANFDKLSVNANIMGDNFDKMTNEGTVQDNSEQILNMVKNKVINNNNADLLVPNAQVNALPTQQNKNTEFDEFLNGLKN